MLETFLLHCTGESSKEAEKEAAELAAQITFKVTCHKSEIQGLFKAGLIY